MNETPIRRLRMENVLWHRAERAAKDLDRTASWVIREALEQYLERHKAGNQTANAVPGAVGVYVVQLEPQAAKTLESVAKSMSKSAGDLIRLAVYRFLDRSGEDVSQGF